VSTGERVNPPVLHGSSPDCLLFTKLDETSTFGPIFNELVRTRKPLSYIADGQRVPEDFHAVRCDQIVDIVLNAR